MVGRSYVHGNLDSFLAVQLLQVFAPRVWHGETDGPVIMSSDSLLKLSETQKTALRTLLYNGNAILVTRASHRHVTALHAINGSFPAISLDEAPASQNTVELYAMATPHGLRRTFAIQAIPVSASDPDPASRKKIHVTMAADWFLEHVRGVQPSGATLDSLDPYPLSNTTYAWSHTHSHDMRAYWAACSSTTQHCSIARSVTIGAWMVYNPFPYAGQPSDYFVMGMSANINTADCKDVYRDNKRIAAYWLRKFNISANVNDFDTASFYIPAGEYAPLAVNPDIQHTTGISWSLGASVTAGPGNNAVGASAGVSFSNETTITYQAVATQVNIGNSAKASWTYDSWNSVNQNIKPTNHACGGPGLQKSTALPPIIYGGAFAPAQNWLWQADRSVREKLGTDKDGFTHLPVEVDTSMLLGWAFYWNYRNYCDAIQKGMGQYQLHGLWVDEVGILGDPRNGIVFDVGCGTTTLFGTIPLGPSPSAYNSQETGNPGQPYPFPTLKVNIPFAPDPAPMTLTSISPVSGRAGTAVTLTGHLLNTATQVNFGGTPLNTFSMTWPADGKAQLTVTAPARPVKGNTVDVSVGNVATTSQTFTFTYVD